MDRPIKTVNPLGFQKNGARQGHFSVEINRMPIPKLM